MEQEKLILSKIFLDDAMTKCSRSLVGKIMKRFEILKDIDLVKVSVKELVYESYRECKVILKSYSSGVIFKVKPEK